MDGRFQFRTVVPSCELEDSTYAVPNYRFRGFYCSYFACSSVVILWDIECGGIYLCLFIINW